MKDDFTRDYRGKRALMLLRVSTRGQERRFGWLSQEQEIRKKLIEPLELRLDEENHIIRDTYTGLEFRERPALNYILEMARRREFDVLVIDVLDRLGRQGLAREIYRMQLRELNVQILTTDPSEHADDDSSFGEMIRLDKGSQAEEELNNTKRRSSNGKRAKIEGDRKKGIVPQLGGSGHRYYGYKYVLSDTGKRIGLTLNHDIIKVDEDGTEWTEVRVIIYMFEEAASGKTLRQIAKLLNEKGIPPPYVAKGISAKNAKYNPSWQSYSISRLIRNTIYHGEARFYKVRSLGKVKGKKDAREKLPENEHIVVSVPSIVTKELAEAARANARQNKLPVSQNNSKQEPYLLRGGYARCGQCGGTMRTQPHHWIKKDGSVRYYTLYICTNQQSTIGLCKGCSILTTTIDEAVWQTASEIIQNPSLIDERVNALRSEDPTASRRRQIMKKLKEISTQLEVMRKNLANLMMTYQPDSKTLAFLNAQLRQLVEQEEGYMYELAHDKQAHEEWKRIQEKLDRIHEECAVWREKLSDSNYEFSYEEKREAVSFLGIKAIVWKKGHNPNFEIQCNPPNVASLL